VVGSDHRIELATHCANEDGIGRKWAADACPERGGREELGVFVSKSSAVTSVRIHRAERDSR
jgi:hypothetical protein